MGLCEACSGPRILDSGVRWLFSYL